MTANTITWLAVISVFIYTASLDSNVPLFLIMWGKRILIALARSITWLKIHPETPWMRFNIYRENENRARKLSKELGLDKNKDWHNDDSN